MSCVYAGTQRKQNTMKGICIYGAVVRRGKKKEVNASDVLLLL